MYLYIFYFSLWVSLGYLVSFDTNYMKFKVLSMVEYTNWTLLYNLAPATVKVGFYFLKLQAAFNELVEAKLCVCGVIW